MARQFSLPSLNVEKLRDEINAKYCEVATSPSTGGIYYR